ncbi:hypothetical protein NEOC65_001216 [Neochlamydia sp. AcF65]|nr:hypothetical protein [Neochlamydia sp. AcF65]
MIELLFSKQLRLQVEAEYVLADNWFGAKDNMEFIHYELKKNIYIWHKV